MEDTTGMWPTKLLLHRILLFSIWYSLAFASEELPPPTPHQPLPIIASQQTLPISHLEVVRLLSLVLVFQIYLFVTCPFT